MYLYVNLRKFIYLKLYNVYCVRILYIYIYVYLVIDKNVIFIIYCVKWVFVFWRVVSLKLF